MVVEEVDVELVLCGWCLEKVQEGATPWRGERKEVLWIAISIGRLFTISEQ